MPTPHTEELDRRIAAKLMTRDIGCLPGDSRRRVAQAIERYVWLQTQLPQVDVATNEIWQEQFGTFYKVRGPHEPRRRIAEWVQLHKANPGAVNYEAALQCISLLPDGGSRVEGSFASKALATIDPTHVVLDSCVLRRIWEATDEEDRRNWRAPYSKRTPGQRITHWVQLHERLSRIYGYAIADSRFPALKESFLRQWKDHGLTPQKMLDVLLWTNWGMGERRAKLTMPISIREFLQGHVESLPEWLASHHPGDPFPISSFLSSRVVFYPGAGSDGHAVKVFGSSHSAHCFVYADSSYQGPALREAIQEPVTGFRGYRLIHWEAVPRTSWFETEHRSACVGEDDHLEQSHGPVEGHLALMEREGDEESHGPAKMAILFLACDARLAFRELFCREGSSVPYAILLQDHGFGGLDHDCFGANGRLNATARRHHAEPEWLLVAENTNAWSGYEPVPGLQSEPGGMHQMERMLYQATPRS